MSALIRRFWSRKSQFEPTNKVESEGPAETSRPVPRSELGFRVVNPDRVNAVTE